MIGGGSLRARESMIAYLSLRRSAATILLLLSFHVASDRFNGREGFIFDPAMCMS